MMVISPLSPTLAAVGVPVAPGYHGDDQSPARLAAEAVRILDAGRGGAHIFNLGHGIWPNTPIDAVAHLVETVHDYKRT